MVMILAQVYTANKWQDSKPGSLISVPALSLSKVWPHDGIHIKTHKKQATKMQEFK